MSNFDNIIQEINTNLPDNNTQAITAAKLRTTLIDLTNAIDTVQDDFQQDIRDELFDLVVDNLTSTSTTNALSANQGRILNETIDDVSHSVSDLSNRVTNLVVDNLTTEDATKALSANQGRILNEKIIDIPENLVNPQTTTVNLSTDVETVDLVISTNTKNWYSYNNAKSAIIPVNQAQTWHLATTRTTIVHYGFFASHPTAVEGENAGLIDDRLYFFNSTSNPGTERTFVPIEGAKYMYIKITEGNSTYSPTTVEYTIQKFLTENDIVNNLETDDSEKALSAAIGPQINVIKQAVNKEPIVSLEQCKKIGFVVAATSLNWYAPTNALSAIVPVQPGEKIYVKAQPAKSTNIGFLAEYPSSPVAGESANLIDGIKYTGTSGHPALDETYTVPATAHYMYVKLHQERTADYTPEVIKYLTNSDNLVIDSYYDNEIYEDTYIEEDIMAIPTRRGVGFYKEKLYKIDPTVTYKVILYSPATSSSTENQLKFYNSSMTLLSGTYAASSTEYWVKMEDITLPQGTVYVSLKGYVASALGSQYTNRGCFALMKPIKNDGSMPRNSNIYCVSKIKSPIMPWNYSEADTTFSQTDIWSAWSFMLPYGTQQITGKNFPLVSYFHGSSGFVTSECMGYNAANTSDGIVGLLRNKGCCVFDINGWGISQSSDQYSRHWGSPIAVATVKKAYEILTTRFNCRKGMVISGISMGGAISKSYCMIHPEDVIGCALEAPSELGTTIRGTMSWNGEVANAWGGYESSEAMEADVNRDRFIGYSPLVKPLIVDSSSNIKFMTNVMNYKSVYNPNASGYNDSNNMLNPTNIDTFYNPFPVEIKIWHGDADTNVSLKYSQCFVNTVRKANCNATLRICPGCTHDLNTYPWVMNEVVNYIVDRISI